jgi:hypothetical protein
MNRLNEEDMMKFAHYLCKKLTLDLDSGENATLNACADLLVELPNEVFRQAVKTQIQVERIIKYNLDLHPVLSSKFDEINAEWNAKYEAEKKCQNEQGKDSNST